MLIQATFFALMLLGVAALSIDLGLARLAQSQMQNSADTAALEGLRQRDAMTDGDRRATAAAMANQLSGGPDVGFVGPGLDDDLNASQLIATASSGSYSINLQPNADIAGDVGINDQTGDMVSGTYSYVARPSECGFTLADPNNPMNCPTAQPVTPYKRDDFSSSGAAVAPSANSTDPSFLVRLRRADHHHDDIDRNPPISSSGESLPLLFGRTGPLPKQSDPDAYAPRRDGITVRATAIADARPALRIGQAGAAGTSLKGATVFAITNACWAGLMKQLTGTCPANPQCAYLGPPIDPTTLCDKELTGSSACAPMDIVGHFTSGAQGALSVGADITFSTPPTSLSSGVGYAPIYNPAVVDLATSQPLVSGFGYVTVANPGDPGYACPVGAAFQIQGTPAAIAPNNASAVPLAGSPTSVTGLPGALLAPVLVR